MQNKQIAKLIDDVNAGKMADRIFRTKLAPTVEYARVWMNEPNVGNQGSSEFYFVLNDDGLIVAAVYDMRNRLCLPDDLHVYVKKAHRKKGLLCKAMNDVILPYFYQQGRTEQEVTFEDPRKGDYCKRNWGFSITGPTSAKKDLTTFADSPLVVGQRRRIRPEEVSAMKIKIRTARLYLTMVKEQIEMSCGRIDDLELDNVIEEMTILYGGIRCSIEDANERLEV